MIRYLCCGLALLQLPVLSACAKRTSVHISDAEFIRMVDEYNADLPPEEQIQCRKVRPIGSNIAEWICRSKWTNDAESLRKEDILHKLHSRPVPLPRN